MQRLKFGTREKSTVCQGLFRWVGIAFLVFILIGAMLPLAMAEPDYIPFDQNSAVLLLQKTVETKLIPLTIESDGINLTITQMKRFAMDWETNQFTLECNFTMDYHKMISFQTSGTVMLSGIGLLSPAEQKMGVRLQHINEFKLDHTMDLVNEAVRMLLDKSLAGKELWYGSAPTASEPLTHNNFTTLLRVVISKKLPLTGAADNASFSLNRLDDLQFMTEPGQMQAKIQMNGTYKKLVTIAFAGQAGVNVHVWMDPNELTGVIHMDEVTDLQLDNSPGFLNGMVRGLINGKLKGEEFKFSWK